MTTRVNVQQQRWLRTDGTRARVDLGASDKGRSLTRTATTIPKSSN